MIEYSLIIIVLGLIGVVIFISTESKKEKDLPPIDLDSPEIQSKWVNSVYSDGYKRNPKYFSQSFQIATQTWSVSGTDECDNIVNSTLRNHCRSVIAQLSKDPIICSTFTSDDKILGAALVGIGQGDYSASDYCYHLYASATKDITYCEMLSDSSIKTSCLNFINKLSRV